MELFKAFFLGITGTLFWDLSFCHPLISSPLSPRGSLSRRFARNGRPILAMANSPRCIYNGKPVEDGRQVASPEPCLNCTCSSGVLLCYLQTCPSVVVPSPECYATRVDGECCPQIFCTVPTEEISTFASSEETTDYQAPSESLVFNSSQHIKPIRTDSNVDPTRFMSASEERVTIPPTEASHEDFTIPFVQSNHRPVGGLLRTKLRDRVRSTTEHPSTESPETEESPTTTKATFSKRRTEEPPVYQEHFGEDGNDDIPDDTSTSSGPDSSQTDFEENSNDISRSCFFGGRKYSEGMAMLSSTQCDYCYCIRGKQMCIRPKCHLNIDGCFARYHSGFTCCPSHYHCESPPVTESAAELTNHQPPGQNSYKPPHQAVSTGCEVDGIHFELGVAVPSRGHCQTCYCTQRRVVCRRLECAPKVDGCEPIVPEGHCCPKEYSCGGSDVSSSPGLVSHSTDDYDVKVISSEPSSPSVESSDPNDPLSATISTGKKNSPGGVTEAQRVTIHLTEDSNLEKVSILPQDNLAILVVNTEEGSSDPNIQFDPTNPSKLNSQKYKPYEATFPTSEIPSPSFADKVSSFAVKAPSSSDQVPSSASKFPSPGSKAPSYASKAPSSIITKIKGGTLPSSSTATASDHSFAITPGSEADEVSGSNGIKSASSKTSVNPPTELQNTGKTTVFSINDDNFYEYDDYDYNRDFYSYDYRGSQKHNLPNNKGGSFRQTFAPFSDYQPTTFGDRISAQDKKQSFLSFPSKRGTTPVAVEATRPNVAPSFITYLPEKDLVDSDRQPTVLSPEVNDSSTDVHAPGVTESEITTDQRIGTAMPEDKSKINRPQLVTHLITEEPISMSNPLILIKGGSSHSTSSVGVHTFLHPLTATTKRQIPGAIKTVQSHGADDSRVTIRDSEKPVGTTSSYVINRKGIIPNVKRPGHTRPQSPSTNTHYPSSPNPHYDPIPHTSQSDEIISPPVIKSPLERISPTDGETPVNNALPKDIAELLWSLTNPTPSAESVDVVAEVRFTKPSVVEDSGHFSTFSDDRHETLESTVQPAPKLISDGKSTPKNPLSAKQTLETTEHPAETPSNGSSKVIFSNHGPSASRRPIPSFHELHLLTAINNHKGATSHHTTFTSMRPKPSQVPVVEFSNHKPFSFKPPSILQKQMTATHRSESDLDVFQSRESSHKLHDVLPEDEIFFPTPSPNDPINSEVDSMVEDADDKTVTQISGTSGVEVNKLRTSQGLRISVPGIEGLRFGDRFSMKTSDFWKGSSDPSLPTNRITPSMRWNDASTNPVTVGFTVKSTDSESATRETKVTTESTLQESSTISTDFKTSEKVSTPKYDDNVTYNETIATENNSPTTYNDESLSGTSNIMNPRKPDNGNDDDTTRSSSGDVTVSKYAISYKELENTSLFPEDTGMTNTVSRSDSEPDVQFSNAPLRESQTYHTTAGPSKSQTTTDYDRNSAQPSETTGTTTTAGMLGLSDHEEYLSDNSTVLNETKLFRAEENYKDSSSFIDRRLIPFGGAFDPNKSENSPLPARPVKKTSPPVPQPQQVDSEDVTDVCFVDGRYYNSGEIIVKSNPCEMCRCFYGHPLCQVQQCPPPPGPSCILEFLPGYCCPRVTCGVSLDGLSPPNEPNSIHPALTEIRPSLPTMDNQWKPLESPHPATLYQRKNDSKAASPEDVEPRDKVATQIPKSEMSHDNSSVVSASPSELVDESLLSIPKTETSAESETPTASPKQGLNPVWDPNAVEQHKEQKKGQSKVSTIHDNSSGVRKILHEAVVLPPSKMSLSPLAQVNLSTVLPSIPVRATVLADLEESQTSSSHQFEYYDVENVTAETGGNLKVSGCNVYGQYYKINDKVSVLSKPCHECICSVEGISCSATC